MSSPGEVQEEPLSTSRIHCTLVEYTSNKMVHFHLRSHVTVELPGNSHAAYLYSDTGVRVCFPYFSSSEISKCSPHTIRWPGFPSLTASCVMGMDNTMGPAQEWCCAPGWRCPAEPLLGTGQHRPPGLCPPQEAVWAGTPLPLNYTRSTTLLQPPFYRG